jgi:hypothetical protein
VCGELLIFLQNQQFAAQAPPSETNYIPRRSRGEDHLFGQRNLA